MRIAVTGTPGTGKTTVTDAFSSDVLDAGAIGADYDIVHLNEVIRERDYTTGYDDERETVIADLEALDSWLAGRENIVFESHLAHHFPADRVVVLRCHPAMLEERLESREKPAASIQENAESEALDVILSEAVERHGVEQVYEIDTTDRSVEGVASEIEAIIAGEREPTAGTVSYLDYLDQ